MPSWKKVIISGSNAALNSLTVTNGITGSLYGTASYASNGGVTQLLAGPNITLSPTNGLGQVTISSLSGSGGGGFNTATGSYGSFYDTTTQTNPVGNIPRSMSLDTTAITNGVSVSGSTSPFNTYIKTENAGVYDIQFSAQLDKTDSGADEIVIWLRKNGTDLTDTATTITLSGNNDKQVAAWNWFVQSAANDYYQIIWRSADTDLRLLAEPQDGHPGIPSVIVTANRVDQFLSNTGSFSGSFTGQFTGSLFGTSSYATQASSASFATTASYVNISSSIINNVDNYILTATGGSTIQGESNLTFNGTTLTVTGSGGRSVALEGGGAGRIDINGDGSAYAVGIKFNSSPGGTALSGIWNYGSGTTQQWLAIGGTAYNNAALYTLPSGNVGIGTTGPNRLLTVAGTTSGLIALNASSYRNTTIGSDSVGNFIVYDDTAGAYRMVINSSGNVGIGTSSPSYPLHVSASVSGTSIYATGDIVAFSDQSVKENIRPIENVLERIGDSRGILYDRIDNGEKDNIGFIAQELEVAFPELVVTNPDGTKAVKYQNAVAVLFEAVKEQQKQINSILKLLDK